MTFSTVKPSNSMDAKKAAIEAAKAASTKAATNPTALQRYIPPGECADRIRIVFDDSGSMSSEIDNAKNGVVEFLRNCIPNQTAVAVHWMNTRQTLALQSDLVQLSTDVQEISLSSGGTPFFNTLKTALETPPTLTRLVAFTDGSPTDQLYPTEPAEIEAANRSSDAACWILSANIIIKIAKAVAEPKCIPIDTVYFGGDSEWEQRRINLLRYLSDQTGGYFLHFDPAKVNFKTAFKYLAPIHRLMLSSGSFRTSIEAGVKA